MFEMPVYHHPDFAALGLLDAPDAHLAPVEQDTVAPEGYHATSMFPEYFKLDGVWRLAEESRMDCVAVWRDGEIRITEFRLLRKGDLVILGRSEDGHEGIYLHADAFEERGVHHEPFSFRQGQSRETSYSGTYDRLYDLLRYEREHGNVLWVMGPACSFDADARSAFAALAEAGYVQGLMAGNALATHDLEAAWLGTALGQDIYTQERMPAGHYHHIDTINEVRRLGSIRAFVEAGRAKDGIMAACVRLNIPFTLVGSIRDDGPLPEVYGNVYEGQNAMRDMIRKATTVICMASTLHTIATGNMTPCYRVVDGEVRPLFLYSVDISEFATNKLRDRGSLAVKTIVTNAQDFMVNCARNLC